MYFIGYDLGSSSVKASLIYRDTNEAVATAQFPSSELEITAKQPGWAEQDPNIWWNSVGDVTHSLLSKAAIDHEEIGAIGISYQMHGLVLIDQNGQAIRPAIIWCDSRAVDIGEEAFNALGSQYCQNQLLNSPGNFTASKLAWVLRQEPALYEKAHKAFLPGDYIAFRMSGIPQTTLCGLSEGILFDFQEESLAKPVLDYYGISKDLIPDIVPTFGIQAQLSQSAASFLGLKKGIPITYRSGDQPNNALSLNVLNPGEIAATAGTSGVIYGVTDQLNNDAKSRVNAFLHVNHAKAQRRIGILLCINGTGILNAWARRTFGAPSYNAMNLQAEKIPIGSEGLVILPFGNGSERILENEDIGAHIAQLQFNVHNQGHIYRAVQEGIACSFNYGVQIMREMNLNPTKIRAGATNLFQSPIFRQTLSNLVDATIELYDTDGSQGAARGAGIGIGDYDVQSAFSGLRLIEETEPDYSNREAYNNAYDHWQNVFKQYDKC